MSVALGVGASSLGGAVGSPAINPSLNANLGKASPSAVLIGSDNLQSYALGNLVGQGPWVDLRDPLALAVMQIQIVGGSLIDGTLSAQSQAQLAANPGFYGVQEVIPTGVLVPPFVMRIRGRVAAGTPVGQTLQFWTLQNGILTPAGWQAHNGCGVFVGIRRVGGSQSLEVIDNTSPGGVIIATGVALGTPLSVSIRVNVGNTYDLFINDAAVSSRTAAYLEITTGVPIVTSSQGMTVGVTNGGAGIAANDAGWDTLSWYSFTGAGTVAGPTSIFYNAETSSAIATSGFSTLGVMVSGPAFDAAATVQVQGSLDGVVWVTLTTIAGNAGLAAIAQVPIGGILAVRYVVALPNDVTRAGVTIVQAVI